jgi:predicted porin
MKKSLFALAAVTAFAGAAQAQSSVTVYGILDVGYIGGNERSSAARVSKQNWNTLGQSAQSTSRLGFRGREDLGGGTAAFFTVEMQVIPNNSGSPLDSNRNAFVGLSQKGIGQAAIGLQNTLIADAMGPTLTSNFATVTGSVLFPGLNGAQTASSGGTAANSLVANTNNGNQSAFTFRTSNTLKVQSERIGGFVGSAMLVMNDNDTTQTANTAVSRTGGKNNQNGWGLGGNFVHKKFTATAAYQSFKAVNPYGHPVGRFNPDTGAAEVRNVGGDPAIFGAVGTGSNVSDNQAYVGAAYNFGILTAYAGWVDRKVTSQINANQFARRTAQEIGVRGNWTPKIQSYASVGNGRMDRFGPAAPTANFIGYQLGTNYILSKRTNLYAIYGYTGTSNASTTAAGAPVSYNANNYALGVRHTF